MSKEKVEELKKLAEPLMKMLNNDEHHPHMKVVVTPTSVELVERVMSTGRTLEYVRD